VSNDIEQKVLEATKNTGYERKRLAWHLACEKGITFPHILINILINILHHHPPRLRPTSRNFTDSFPILLKYLDISPLSYTSKESGEY